jgi:uncharacterized membrane protein YozB (DUF420 family)
LFGADAPWGVNVFLVVMVAILPGMAAAIALARAGRIRAHATVMVASFVLFLGSLVVFEWSVQTMAEKPPIPKAVLVIHLCFALPGLVLWVVQLLRGKRALEQPARHRRLGRIVVGFLIATVATGIWLYAAMFG